MTSTPHAETTIVADPDVPLVRIVREFDAPVAQVFRAHTEPDLLVRWLGPRGLTMTIDHFDCRTGGSYRYVHSRNGEDFGFHGSFHEVRQHERIVWTFTYEGEPDTVALETLTFEEIEGGRTRLRVLSVVRDFQTRDGMLSSGMDVGVNEGYDKLDELLVTGA
jgi:uncharacterized protein YndB with AHSA1/START domain